MQTSVGEENLTILMYTITLTHLAHVASHNTMQKRTTHTHTKKGVQWALGVTFTTVLFAKKKKTARRHDNDEQ